MNEPSDEERAFFKEHLGKLNQALALLSQETPPPDMPLQVAALLREVITAWIRAVNDDWYSHEVESLDAPDLQTLMEWMDEGVCEATDGCLVEPDGHCSHGHPSWLLELGLI
jgi:hypothetical protein